MYIYGLIWFDLIWFDFFCRYPLALRVLNLFLFMFMFFSPPFINDNKFLADISLLVPPPFIHHESWVDETPLRAVMKPFRWALVWPLYRGDPLPLSLSLFLSSFSFSTSFSTSFSSSSSPVCYPLHSPSPSLYSSRWCHVNKPDWPS